MNFPNNGFAPPPPGFPAPQGAPAPAPAGFPQQYAQPSAGGYAPAPAGYPMPAPQYGAPAPQPFGAPQAPAAPPQAGLFGGGLAGAEEGLERLPPLPQGGHEEFVVDKIWFKRSTAPGATHVSYFMGECTIVKSPTVPAGTRFLFQEKITGHQYDSHKSDSYARIRGFCAVVWCGLNPDSPDARVHVTEELILGLMSDANPAKGKRGAIANVEHKVTKAKIDGRTGQQIAPKVIGKYKFALVGSPVQAAPAPAPAAPVAQAPVAPSFPPAGWQDVSSAYPGHWSNGQVTITESDLRALVASGRA